MENIDEINNNLLFQRIDAEIKRILKTDSEIGIIQIQIRVRKDKDYMAFIKTSD